MTARYSGDVTITMKLVRMRGWDGKMGPFYKASLRCPEHSVSAILSAREAGVSKDYNGSDAYDKAARAFLRLAKSQGDRAIVKYADMSFGRFEIVRVARSECPIERELYYGKRS